MQELLKNYFPQITTTQLTKYNDLKRNLLEWNSKINVISRKDESAFEIEHLLHSLSIAKFIRFTPSTEILDFGTGGGFPGIPLAIMFPDSNFTLIDSIGKKTKVVEAVVSELGLSNVVVKTGRVEELAQSFDFIVCRAVGRLSSILPWVEKKIKKLGHNEIPNGFIFLKGGDLEAELSEVKIKYQRIPISTYFSEPFFETKEIVYLSPYQKMK